MQPAHIIVTGRCWAGAGRCILHLYLPVCALPQVTTGGPHTLHRRHTTAGGGGRGVEARGKVMQGVEERNGVEETGSRVEQPGKEEKEESYKFESFILRFQRIFTLPKNNRRHSNHRHHHPSSKGSKGRNSKPSSTSSTSSTSLRPYQPYNACNKKIVSANQIIDSPRRSKNDSIENNNNNNVVFYVSAKDADTHSLKQTHSKPSTASSTPPMPVFAPTDLTGRLEAHTPTDTQIQTDIDTHTAAHERLHQTHTGGGHTQPLTDIHTATDTNKRPQQITDRQRRSTDIHTDTDARGRGQERQTDRQHRIDSQTHTARERREEEWEIGERTGRGNSIEGRKGGEMTGGREGRARIVEEREERGSVMERGGEKSAVMEEREGKRGTILERRKGEEEEEEGGRGGGVEQLGRKERSVVQLILDAMPRSANREELEECLRQNTVPSFCLLRRVCASVSQSAMPGTVEAIQGVAQCLHPHQYAEHLGLDYYLAGALCYAGDVERSLAVLLHLHRHTTVHRSRKVANMTQFVLYQIVESEEEDQVAQAVDFVDTVANEMGQLGPALSLWSATFTSPLFRLQQVSEWLLERHPNLVDRLGQRVEGLVERAEWGGDQDLLQRILHLTLQHKLSAHYPSATNALLQLQCAEGDLRGAEETIKFAQRLGVRVTPAAIHRFLALLSRHRRPAPLALLALKYRPPPARSPIPPPSPPKYKF